MPEATSSPPCSRENQHMTGGTTASLTDKQLLILKSGVVWQMLLKNSKQPNNNMPPGSIE
jgi:hypothetical protein